SPAVPQAIADAVERALDGPDRTSGRSRLAERNITLEQSTRRYLALYEESRQGTGGERKPGGRKTVFVIRHGPFYKDPRVTKEVIALLEDSTVDVVVLCAGADIEPWVQHERLRVLYLRRSPISESPARLALQAVGFAVRCWWALRRTATNPSSVIVHSIPSWLLLATRSAKRRGARVVLDHHEPESEMLAEAGVPPSLTRLYERVEGLAIRSADAVVDVSPVMAERSRRLGARSQMTVENSPLVFASNGDTAPPRWDLAVFGSLIERYDLTTLDAALELIRDPIDVLQVGEGPESLETNHSGGQLTNYGYLPPPRLQDMLRLCKIGFVGLKPSAFTNLVCPNRLWELVELRVPAVVPRTELLTELLSPDTIFYEGGNAASLARAIEAALALTDDERLAITKENCERLAPRFWSSAARDFVDFCVGRGGIPTTAA
ncbi:MAG: glycosyltransferase, partial [Actinomycetota bacterium]|nr:glycosyltransferase [Actinomycetota bacterium]